CPTDTFSPRTTGCSASTCTETLSCRLLPAPIVMGAESARSTALYHALAPSSIVTAPTMRAPAATKAESEIEGVIPARASTDASEEIVMLPRLPRGAKTAENQGGKRCLRLLAE